MKKQIPQFIMIFALVMVIAIALPASFAKYSSTADIENIPLKKTVIFFNTEGESTLTNNNKSATAPEADEFIITKSGYYLVLAKGGDGAFGYKNTSSSRDYYAGGSGGVVYGVYYLKENDVIKAYPGGYGVCGHYDGGTAYAGAGGLNEFSKTRFKGGNGSADVVSKGSLADLFSSAMASGGGGAATLVFLNGTEDSDILLIAGGGGASGSWDSTSRLSTVASGIGGAGGSVSSTNYTDVSNPNGTVYFGENGTGSTFQGAYTNEAWTSGLKKTIITFGYGGGTSTDNGGQPGYSNYRTYLVSAIKYAGAASGTVFNAGCGGDCNDFGGGGGGGYCGGGGGAGTSIEHANGGGGGGSSFVAEKANGITVLDYKGDALDVTNDEACENLPEVTDGPNTGDGYVIVKWLGKTY